MEDLSELARDILEQGKPVRFQAKGWSMRPFIRDGDFIVVSPIENSSIKIGEVVFYSTTKNKVIVHRVIRKYKKNGRMTMLIKGDASFGSPEKVDIQNILGNVVAIERNGRKKRLDTKLYQIKGLFFAGISPLSRWIYPIGSKVKHSGRKLLGNILEELQSLKLYRILVKKLMKENIHYQIASSEDSYSLSRFYRYNQRHDLENPADALSEQLKNIKDSEYYFVAKQKDRVIGGVTLTKFPETNYPYVGWWLFGLKVNWRYRGIGIGEKLTKMAIEVVDEKSTSEIKLLVFENANPANNLYRKIGFCQISIPELDKQLEEEAKKSSRRRIILAKDIKSG